MYEIEIQKTPNQSFSVEIDGDIYLIELRTIEDVTFASINRNGVNVKRNVRCVNEKPLIPYRYLTKGGNFMFYCINGDNPYYTKFGDTQTFLWLTNKEMGIEA